MPRLPVSPWLQQGPLGLTAPQCPPAAAVDPAPLNSTCKQGGVNGATCRVGSGSGPTQVTPCCTPSGWRASPLRLLLFVLLSQHREGERCRESRATGEALRTNAEVLSTESNQLVANIGLSAASVRMDFNLASLSSFVRGLNWRQIWQRSRRRVSSRHFRQLECGSLTSMGLPQDAQGLKPGACPAPGTENAPLDR